MSQRSLRPKKSSKSATKPIVKKVNKSRSGGANLKAKKINVKGDVVARDKTTNVSINLQMAAFAPSPDLQQLRGAYIDHLKRTYRALDFKGIPQLDTFSRELLLEDVYVPLLARPELPAGETLERRLAGRRLDKAALPAEAFAALEKMSAAPVGVEQALADKSQVIVIGDPGSGKSTLLKHLTLRLAYDKNAPLPILVPLNAYAEALSKGDCNLQDYLPEYFKGLTQGVAGLKPLFDEAIKTGAAVILLDGLDEVQRDRAHLVNKVEAFTREVVAQKNKVIVTSRIVGYRESPLTAKDWALYTLLDFDHEAIEQFAAKWCVAFETSTLGDTPEARSAAEVERRSLLEAIDVNPSVASLASNPLLLTILALIKRNNVVLPNRRVELYEVYLKTLISSWSKARSLDKRPVGPPLDYLQTISVLGPLALWLREENPTAGLVTEERLIDWLAEYFAANSGLPFDPALAKGREFLDSVRKYSNLLLERGHQRFGFIHLTFEEALAARGLVRLGQRDLSASLTRIERHLTEPGWRETILLAVGLWGLVREEPERAGEVVHAMLNMKCAGDEAGQNVLLAGACLEDVGEAGLGHAAAREVIDALLGAAHDRLLPPTMQRDAGFSLGCCGWQPDDLDAFIPIPAGPFKYGDKQEPRVIQQPFDMARYPVTNRQYRLFIKAHGYDRREFWSEEGWSWRTGTYDSKATEDYVKNWLANRPVDKRSEPFWWHDAEWNNPLAPVVGVSWFEAEAYCNWLAKELGRPIRLPTEEEWERAARHTDGREYPWGDEFDRNKLNSAEFWQQDTEVVSTTIVGQFPQGNSAAGISDMSGNVWEWTSSWYDRAQTYRVLRGGAWLARRYDARCADRDWFDPGYYLDSIGFRVVSPGLISGS